MFTQLLAFVTLASVASVHAGPTPQTPDGVPQVGGDCVVSWLPDASGIWKTTHIELMAGPNVGMQHLTTVGTVDTTDPAKTSFTFKCPDVSPNAPVFFYQFTSPFAPAAEMTWTTRFPIADATGKLVPAPELVQPDGSKLDGKDIPWGKATLANPASAVAAPTDVGSQVKGAGASGAGASGAGSSNAAGLPVSATDSDSDESSSTGTSSVATRITTTTGAPKGSITGSPDDQPTGVINKVPTTRNTADPTASYRGTNSTGAALTMRVPLYALGAAAAFAVAL